MRSIFLLGLIVLLLSCEKEDENNPVTTSSVIVELTHMPLEIGNYWVYQHYSVDPHTGTEQVMSHKDSLIITRDTIINDNSYFIIEGESHFPTISEGEIIDILRDSIGYLVDIDGNVLFSEANFVDTLQTTINIASQDTLYIIDYILQDHDALVTVPAGEFDDILNYKGTLTYLSHPIPSNTDNPRISNNYFAEGVGKILGTYHFLSSPNTFEKRLINYHIND